MQKEFTRQMKNWAPNRLAILFFDFTRKMIPIISIYRLISKCLLQSYTFFTCKSKF